MTISHTVDDYYLLHECVFHRSVESSATVIKSKNLEWMHR